MTYVVTGACQNCVYTDCVTVCPVDCFYELPGRPMLYINTDECIDCALCEDACPVKAIHYESDVPYLRTDESMFVELAKECTENNEGHQVVTQKRNPLSTDGPCDPNW